MSEQDAEEASTEEIVIRYTSGPTAGMNSVARYILGHLMSLDAEFSVVVRQQEKKPEATP